MPDGDIVHNRLSRFYQKPYKWLCEGTASVSERTWAVMKALKQDLIRKGDLPIILAQQMGEKVRRIFSGNDGNSSIDWAALNMELDRLAQRVDGAPYLKELILSAAKSLVNDLRYRRNVSVENASETILQHYVNKVYASEFKDRIPLTSEHYAGIDEVTLKERIEEIQPDILAVANKWAKRANADGSVAKLRLPCRRQVKEVDMDEDLLAG
jgi:hypothetical protein